MKRIIAICLLCWVSTSNAADLETLIHGGRLYDVWWTDTQLPEPSTTHPSYPAKGKKSASVTWRCKECHGWDYRGKEGIYGKGDHYTGIKGIGGAAGQPEAKIIAIISNKQHGYDKLLSQSDLSALAQFVSEGQMEMAKYIALESGQIKGSVNNGQRYYREYCSDCHGNEGQSLKLDDGNVGSIASKNPWETLHKIRFGHPGAVMDTQRMHNNMMGRHHYRAMRQMWQPMPPMLGTLSEQEQIDLLAYLQTLPH